MLIIVTWQRHCQCTNLYNALSVHLPNVLSALVQC